MAVRQCPFALRYAGQNCRRDKSIVLEALRLDARTIRYADEDLKKDAEGVCVVRSSPRGMLLLVWCAWRGLQSPPSEH